MPRKKKNYFKRQEGAPDPIVVSINRRVNFSEVDIMGIVWYGRYAAYFEEGSAELGRCCNLSYKDFYNANLRAVIAECHIDYYESLHLGEEFTIKTLLVWHAGSRINTEYQLIKGDGNLAAAGYTIRLLTDINGRVCVVSPPLLTNCRRRWKRGDFFE